MVLQSLLLNRLLSQSILTFNHQMATEDLLCARCEDPAKKARCGWQGAGPQATAGVT